MYPVSNERHIVSWYVNEMWSWFYNVWVKNQPMAKWTALKAPFTLITIVQTSSLAKASLS